MHVQRTAVAIAAGVGIVCTFLPWATIPLLGSIDGTKTDGRGWITLGLCAAALVCAVVGDKNAPLSLVARIGSGLFGLAVGVVALWTISGIKNNPFGDVFSIGVGLYLLVIAGAAIALLPVLIKPAPRKQPPSSLPPP